MGGYSIVEVELSLFKAATDYGEYLHYHLLSGQDMPIKTQDEIHKFCSRNSNISFIDINKPDLTSDFGKIIYRRVSIKRYISEEKKRESFVLKWFDRVILGIQYYLLKCDFVKKTGIQLRYGSQWCSLCDGHIRILLQNIDKIEYYFKKSSIPDELFVQSILAEMGLEKEIAGNKREIMWNHNDKLHPHVWVKEDYEKLKRSNAFFARKFDENFDKIVIDLVYEYIKP
ncbi:MULTISPECIES: beta-1,6-N-acetylglucosaminyltransferase [Blautia]|uniref:beta-1,6-N-acetylglucosaminyltransferase n=1 Tax=Blautia TaxID=572511 RepID=UPI000BA3D9FB|nr:MULTISPECIES: beta-1,6-N-acetylglucosaminyltransferase [Blautia]